LYLLIEIFEINKNYFSRHMLTRREEQLYIYMDHKLMKDTQLDAKYLL